MLRAAFLAVICLAMAQPSLADLPRATVKRIKLVERELARMREARLSAETSAASASADPRMASNSAHVRQWAHSAQGEQRIEALLAQARGAESAAAADAALAQAQGVIDGASRRALAISDYLNRRFTPYWRDSWQLFARANGLPTEPHDAGLLDAERVIRGHLENGDVRAALAADDALDARLHSVIAAAVVDLAQSKDASQLEYIPRKTPCPDRNARADPGLFYPPSAKRRGEQGVSVLRIRVDAAGCGTHAALLVSSGYPALDEAAFVVVEHSGFEPAAESGVARESFQDFKVGFRLH